ncbi:MAG TPA: aminotransferase, partial [Leifsonia sp.]
MTTDDAVGVRLRPEILAVPPYKQGRAAPADGFKLSSNENPFPPLPSVLAAATAALGELNRYPNASGADLRARLAERHGVGLDQVHLGNGSVSLLA